MRTDAGFARVLGIVLRVGVNLSAAVVLCGGIIYLLIHGGASPQFALFRGEPADLRSISGIINDARHGSGRGVIQLGVLLLIATPLARVLFAIGGFVRQRNWLYSTIAALVLILLIIALTSA